MEQSSISSLREAVFVDTTLRDGAQSPGVFFDRPTKMAIVTSLSRIGVREIEIGSPCLGENEIEDLRTLLSLPLPSVLFPWLRPLDSDYDQAMELGFTRVHISFPTSKNHRLSVKGMGENEILTRLECYIRRFRSEGREVSIGLEDGSRADPAFLLEMVMAVKEAGGVRVRYCDTVGSHHPARIAERVAMLLGPGLPIEVHCHNDLGMATANTVAAFHAGARFLSTTVTGVGERAGNAAMEEVAFALRYSEEEQSDCGLDLPGLVHLSRQVHSAIGRTLSPYRPVVGSRIFHHSSGIHVDGVLKNPENYELFPPEQVESKRKIVVTHQTGKAGIRNVLERMGYHPHNDLLERLVPIIREEGWRLKGIVPPQTILNRFISLLGRDPGELPAGEKL